MLEWKREPDITRYLQIGGPNTTEDQINAFIHSAKDGKRRILYGGGGEVETRPYIAARYYDAPLYLQNNVEALTGFICNHMMHNLIVGDSKRSFAAFQKNWV